ncbi:MAG: cyclic nucleotide-binding domain-containing protein [Alphaproteobacteria bacterium]|nr:cyclic nucleotide-binding domain-containing protein [Alphaproteobacteria bacterium]
MFIELNQALGKIAAFSKLPAPVLAQLQATAGMQRVSKGSVLFREGERADFVYGLVEGAVALTSGTDHDETVADFMAAGELLLVPPALLRAPYMVSAEATRDLLVIMIPAVEFRRLVEEEISICAAMNHLMARHWRLLLRQVIHAKIHDADTRLKNYLIDQAGKSSGPATVRLPGSKKDLAAHLGVRSETLSRSLKRLAALGVRSIGSDFVIDDLARLQQPLRTAA